MKDREAFYSGRICCWYSAECEWDKAGQHRCPLAGSVYNDCCESLTANESVIGGRGSIGAGL